MKLGNMLVMGLTTLAMAPSSWALVGGPWDHLIKDVYSRTNSDGLYEASVSMKNGSGFIKFTSSTERVALADPITTTTTGSFTDNGTGFDFSFNESTQTLASQSNSVIFHKGSAYYGTMFGSVNGQSKSVIGGGGGQSSTLASILEAAQAAADAANAFVNVRGFAESMSLNFTGRIVRDVPEIRFEAKGKAIFFSRPALKLTQIPYELPDGITGIGGGGDDSITIPDPVYQIEVDSKEVIDDSVKIRVNGGRVSLQTNFNAASTTTTTGGGN